jgi:hypothetical protein
MKKKRLISFVFISTLCLLFGIIGCSNNNTNTWTINTNADTYITSTPGDVYFTDESGQYITVNISFMRFDLNEFVEVSDVILEGQVIDILPSQIGFSPVYYSDHPIIYTDIIIKVDKYLYGYFQPEKIAVRITGGRIENKIFITEYEADFSKGENVLLFLFRESNYEMTPVPEGIEPQAYYKTMRLYQGKFTIDGDKATNLRGDMISVSQTERLAGRR